MLSHQLRLGRSFFNHAAALALGTASASCASHDDGTAPAPGPAPAVSADATPMPLPEPGASGIGDSYYPGLGNGGYDVSHYDIRLEIANVDTSELRGTTSIQAVATQSLSAFNLDFLGFTVASARVNGANAAVARDGQELTLTPEKPLRAGDAFTVEIVYSGTPSRLLSASAPATAGDSALVGWRNAPGTSFVVSEPDGAATFFPVNDHPLDKATYTLEVTVPKPYSVAANGVLATTTDLGDRATYAFQPQSRMASYLVTVAVAEFDVDTAVGPHGLPIRNYFAKGIGATTRAPFALQPQMLTLFESAFGPYPFEVYGSLVVDDDLGFALEDETLSVFGSDMGQVEPDIAEQVVAHEAAHQWFGDSLSVADWSDIWLNEGFATYAEGLWIQQQRGQEAFQGWINWCYEHVSSNLATMAAPGDPPAGDLFNEGVYFRGALLLHALRVQVGETAFFQILHTYAERFKDGNVTTADFEAVAQEVSGADLGALFDAWLYGATLPAIPGVQ